MSRGTSLAVITVGVLLVSAGCLSGGVPGGIEPDATTTAWPSIPSDSDCSPVTPTNATNSSKIETPNRLPSGPVHLRIRNRDSMEHDVGVSIHEPGSKSVFAGTATLEGRSKTCVADAIPRPSDGPISYEVSVTVDGQTVASRTYSIGAGIIEIQVIVEDSEQVQFGRVIN